jgi:hypothetical protein
VSKLTFDLIPVGGFPHEDEPDSKKARTRSVVWLTLGLWLANFAMATLGMYLSGDANLIELSLIRGGMLCVGLLLCAAIHKLLQTLTHMSFARRVAVMVVMSLVAAEIYGWLNYFSLAAVLPERLGTSIKWGAAISNVATWTWFFLAWAGLRIALEYSWHVKEVQRRALALQALAHSAKLRALHSQVNPHFLFNSLNSIASLIVDDRRQDADRMVGKLADFFRLSLAADPEEEITLLEELELQAAYLEIEQLRYPDLELKLDVASEAASAAVPALLLQPIVENAVKYGVASSSPPAMISIRASAEAGQLTIIVEDRGNAPGAVPKPGAGIGLNNVRARLHERYGNDASLAAERISDAGFRVTIRMPLEEA